MLTVFVIDDHEAHRASNIRVLRELGCEVTEFSNSELALEALKSIDKLGAIFIDVDMSKLDGSNFFNTIRTLRPDIPMVITSAKPYPNREVLIDTAHIPYRLFGSLSKTGVEMILESIKRRRT